MKSSIQPMVHRSFLLISMAILFQGLNLFQPGKCQAQGITYTVNSDGDEHDLDYNPTIGQIVVDKDNKCDVGGGKCTLRAAIESHNANRGAGGNIIEFDIPIPAGSTAAVIKVMAKPTEPTPVFGLPVIFGQLHIDGTSHPNYQIGDILIEVDGTDAGAGQDGLVIRGTGTVIEALSIHSFEGRGVVISASGGVAENNVIRDNFIGTDATGRVDKGNQAGGILIAASFMARLNEIVSNLIIGNEGPGIEIDGGGDTSFTSATDNLIHQNAIGGSIIPNEGEGVLIHNGAQTNRIVSNTISNNKKDGVRISGLSTDNNIVGDNRIGIRENAASPNGSNGVAIDLGAKHNEIGGSTVFGFSNTISGNTENGVLLTGEGTEQNLVGNNLIGTNREGLAPVPNKKNGVLIQDKAKDNKIGFGVDFDITGKFVIDLGNVISGNKENGVLFTGESTDKNHVKNNLIGITQDGIAPLPNEMNGVLIQDKAKDNRIGAYESETGFGNTISGNKENGVLITGEGTDKNIVGQNFIGPNPFGNAAVPNEKNGVLIQDKAKENRIGVGLGVQKVDNFISGNTENGVLITGEGTDDNIIRHNFIGLDLLFNKNGVVIQDNAKGNQIEFNTISQNRGKGVLITETGTTGNKLSANDIFGNADLGIDLGNDGVSDNDEVNDPDGDPGPNNLQNYPALTSASIQDRKITIKGTLWSRPLTTYEVQYFENTDCDPSGFGEGEFFLGVDFDVLTDDFGLAEFTSEITGDVPVGTIITATVTDPEGNTSEFSKCIVVVQGTGPGKADGQVEHTADKTSLQVGETVTFTVKLSNAGPDEATGIAVTTTSTAGLSVGQVSPSLGSYDSNTGIWTIPSLGSSSEATLTLVATATQPGIITHTAEITASDQEDPDSAPGNNEPGEDDQSSISLTVEEEEVSAEQQIENLIEQIIDLLAAGELSSKEGKKLIQELGLALKQLKKENSNAAINKLEGFIKEVQRLMDKGKLAEPIGQELILAAQKVIDQLSGDLLATPGQEKAVTHFEEDPEKALTGIRLLVNYPNPFGTATSISFELAKQSRVQLVVYDQTGRIVLQLLDEVVPAGVHNLAFRPANLPAGMYILQVKTDNAAKAIRMIYSK